MKIEHLLRKMVNEGASDLHLKVGGIPNFRLKSRVVPIGDEKITIDMMDDFINDIMNRQQKTKWENMKEMDFAVSAGSLGRFRVNLFRQRGTVALAIRHVKGEVPNFETLFLPEVILDLAMKKRGLILVTGTTGSGKSTSLASMVNHVNEHSSSHIITIEDPIEYVHKDKASIVTQRELGQDTDNFANALKASLRQDPDMILVGEIRDLDTFQIALTAADTGHLVMSTIHTTNASETLKRILSMYEPHLHDEVRSMLASTLVAIISQRLLPKKDGNGLVPAAEILVNTPTIKEYLQDTDKFEMINSAIAEGHTQYGSQTFDQSIFKLYKDDMITYDTAYKYASNPNDFDLKVRGIESASDRSWM